MFLHEDRELFHDVIVSAALSLGIQQDIVEKDYYVTIILRELSRRCPECVFKGGTSLSKCHHVLNRFSEDIDIAFTDKLTGSERKRLKNEIILGISKELNIPISNWQEAKSRRDYNCYTFSYSPMEEYGTHRELLSGVKMEVTLCASSFPTVKLSVDSYIYRFLKEKNIQIVDKYDLNPFDMNVQEIDRTLVDKVFALCDYYLQDKIKRYSRHIYDIYKLLPMVRLDDGFKELIRQVRSLRANMGKCPSAKEEVYIPELLKEIIQKEIYKEDYNEITTYFQNEPVEYEQAIEAVNEIACSGMFE